MHSSRMRTARFSCHLGGWGVSAQGGCLPKGVSAQKGVSAGGMSAQGGVCQGGYLPRRGMSVQKEVSAQADTPPPV